MGRKTLPNGNGGALGSYGSLAAYVYMVRDVGFPILLAAYLVWKIGPALEANTRASYDSAAAVRELTIAVREGGDLSIENNTRLRQLMGEIPWDADPRPTLRAPVRPRGAGR